MAADTQDMSLNLNAMDFTLLEEDEITQKNHLSFPLKFKENKLKNLGVFDMHREKKSLWSERASFFPIA